MKLGPSRKPVRGRGPIPAAPRDDCTQPEDPPPGGVPSPTTRHRLPLGTRSLSIQPGQPGAAPAAVRAAPRRQASVHRRALAPLAADRPPSQPTRRPVRLTRTEPSGDAHRTHLCAEEQHAISRRTRTRSACERARGSSRTPPRPPPQSPEYARHLPPHLETRRSNRPAPQALGTEFPRRSSAPARARCPAPPVRDGWSRRAVGHRSNAALRSALDHRSARRASRSAASTRPFAGWGQPALRISLPPRPPAPVSCARARSPRARGATLVAGPLRPSASMRNPPLPISAASCESRRVPRGSPPRHLTPLSSRCYIDADVREGGRQQRQHQVMDPGIRSTHHPSLPQAQPPDPSPAS